MLESIHYRILHPLAKVPTRAYSYDAGWDLTVCETVAIPPSGNKDVRCGLAIAMPEHFWAHIVPRSSTLRRYDLHIVPAVIDAGYRGEIFLQVHNLRGSITYVKAHQRLAQLIFHRIEPVAWQESESLSTSDRGERGFGSSGK